MQGNVSGEAAVCAAYASLAAWFGHRENPLTLRVWVAEFGDESPAIIRATGRRLMRECDRMPDGPTFLGRLRRLKCETGGERAPVSRDDASPQVTWAEATDMIPAESPLGRMVRRWQHEPCRTRDDSARRARELYSVLAGGGE